MSVIHSSSWRIVVRGVDISDMVRSVTVDACAGELTKTTLVLFEAPRFDGTTLTFGAAPESAASVATPRQIYLGD